MGWFNNYAVQPALAFGQGIAEDAAVTGAMSPTMANGYYAPVLRRIGLPTIASGVTKFAPYAGPAYVGASLGVGLGWALGDGVIRPLITEPYMHVPGEGVHSTDGYGDSIRSSERMANAPSQSELDYVMNRVNARRKAKGLPTYNSARYGGSGRPGVKPSGALGTRFNNSVRAIKDTLAPDSRNVKTHVSAPTFMQVADYAHNNTLHRIDRGKAVPVNRYTQFNFKDPNFMQEYRNRSLARLGNTTK